MDIICTIFSIVPYMLLIFAIPFIIITFLATFKRKKFSKAETFLKYAVLIVARNEEPVIESCIQSIKNAEHGNEIDIYVLAHNCTDNTALFAKNAGAYVYTYDNPNEKTKGFAMKALVDNVIKDGLISNYDGYFVVDADNLFRKDYFIKMNDAFISENKESVISAYQNSRNFDDNIISSLYGFYQLLLITQELRPKAAFNISPRVRGTSYLVPTFVLTSGFPYTSIIEDWEFTTDLILKDVKFTYCNEAEFFDEQPTKFKIMIRQRFRWIKGCVLIAKNNYIKLLKAFFTPAKKGGSKRKWSIYGHLLSVTPYPLVATINDTLFLLVSITATFFGVDFKEMIIRWAAATFTKYLYFIVIQYFITLKCLITERKHIPKMNVFLIILTILLYPFFYLISVPLHIATLFVKKVKWDPIPHTSTKRPDQA